MGILRCDVNLRLLLLVGDLRSWLLQRQENLCGLAVVGVHLVPTRSMMVCETSPLARLMVGRTCRYCS